MKFQRTFVMLMVLAAMACGVARAQSPAAAVNPGASGGGSRTLVVDDYFRIKEVGDPQLSPDGKWVAYTVKTANLKEDKNRRRIWMVPASGGGAVALGGEK